ncbi:MAG TPA: hypothetical protein VFF03_01720 [Rhodocyclaceae bacterium]|nr:hypothetical protein [Rhodocyclaceae bacterium]
MAEKVFLQESKEYQMKIDIGRCFGTGPGAPVPSDEALFEASLRAIRQAVESLSQAGEWKVTANDNRWLRAGIRYDAADGRLKAHKLTLAIEAADKRTKLKCKQHDFVPEMLFDKPEKATVFPDITRTGDYKKHDTTLKREEDLHFDNIKYCASGSFYLKGRQTQDKDSGFFTRYYPKLEVFFPETVPLVEVSHWDESIYDDMRARWGRNDIDTWMLVIRRDAATQAFLEAELSFKVIKALADDWDYRALRDASRLYLALRQTGIFQELPPIFTFANPVSSIDIIRAPAGVQA